MPRGRLPGREGERSPGGGARGARCAGSRPLPLLSIPATEPGHAAVAARAGAPHGTPGRGGGGAGAPLRGLLSAWLGNSAGGGAGGGCGAAVAAGLGAGAVKGAGGGDAMPGGARHTLRRIPGVKAQIKGWKVGGDPSSRPSIHFLLLGLLQLWDGRGSVAQVSWSDPLAALCCSNHVGGSMD